MSADSIHGSPVHTAPLQFKGEIMDFDLGMEIDHRKRRRNRTTQSCLNCHTSKRKCDRKRPCQRCIQLGLTGLCVYEVDDPALRDDPNIDESTRLRNRIAELESLVRELRGKPHPRWAEPNYCDGDASEKWHSRSTRRSTLQFRQRAATLSGATPMVKSEQPNEPLTVHQPQLYRMSPSPPPTLSYDAALAPTYHRDAQHSAQQSPNPSDCALPQYSPPSSSGSGLGYPQHRQSNTSMLSMPNTDLYYQQPYIRSEPTPVEASCTCLTNPAAGHPLIALNHQLQNTLELLRHLPEHATTRNHCLILKRINQLHDLMQGGAGETPPPPFETLPTPESELMSPVSTSSHTSSLNNGIHPDWSSMSATPSSQYDSYFPAVTESSMYHKPYHLH